MVERRTLTEIARNAGLTRQALSYRFARALQREMTRPGGPRVPGSDCLILLADGLYFRFKRKPWVLYLMALKRPRSEQAVILEPLLQPGVESKNTWRKAFNSIPQRKRGRIKALVSDDFSGFTALARENRWVLQLCHFHLIAALRRRRGSYHRWTVSARALRGQGYRLVKIALETGRSTVLKSTINRIQRLLRDPEMPWSYRDRLRQFLRGLASYRAYRSHPHLGLPRTTGTVESMGRMFRDLMRHSRSVSTPTMLDLWARNYFRLRTAIACRRASFSTN